MHDLIKGTAHAAIRHLRKIGVAHLAVMEGVATHAQKEHAKRQEAGREAMKREAISKSIWALGKPLRPHRAVLRDEQVWLLGCLVVGRTRGAVRLDEC